MFAAGDCDVRTVKLVTGVWHAVAGVLASAVPPGGARMRRPLQSGCIRAIARASPGQGSKQLWQPARYAGRADVRCSWRSIEVRSCRAVRRHKTHGTPSGASAGCLVGR